MGYVKRKYQTKKVGFSGTLDPFATGCLIVATGQYTRLFQYLHKTPKAYAATLWLGANSESLDIENVDSIQTIPALDTETIQEALSHLKGERTYYPPKFSAKKVGGKRAYELAREGLEVNLKTITSTVYDIKLIHYNHPFIHFEAVVSEGTYIRSLGAMITDRLGVDGTLSSLKRLYEGKFHYDKEKALNPLEYLKIPQNHYHGNIEQITLGQKLRIDDFRIQEDGEYWVDVEEFFAIIAITEGEVSYKLNRMGK